MDSNIKDGSNYLDGVPMKISPKFWPPKPVSIPTALDTKFSTDLLAEQYDFSLERSVLEYNQKRLSELEASKAKSTPTNLNSTSESTSSDIREDQQEAVKKPNAQCVQSWQSDVILQPKPSDKVSGGNDIKVNNTKINLSDFENDTSSPFDYMELQTINDLEELNSVFQDIHSKNSVNKTKDDSTANEDMAENVTKSASLPLSQNPWTEEITSNFSQNFTSDIHNRNNSVNRMEDSIVVGNDSVSANSNMTTITAKSASFPLSQNPWSEKIPSIVNQTFATDIPIKNLLTRTEEGSASNEDIGTNVAKSVSFPLAQNPWPEKISSSLSEDFASGLKRISLCDYASNGKPSFSCPTELLSGSNIKGQQQIKDYFCDTINYSTLSQVPYISSNAGAHTVKNPYDGLSLSLRGSKSYTDISSLSDVEIMNSTKERSRTPPSFYSGVTQSEDSQPLSLNEDHFGRTLNESSNGVSNCDNIAYEELDETSRCFVDCITEMGFAQGQVARAVKHLGTDEKKVVEHLCQIQALEESGYEGSEAEAALHLHDYNRDQAKEFLDLVNQFQDLGFEKDAIKKALVQNKNDWNKTIDALLP